MAYCPHCDEDRPIKRQSVGNWCRYCFASNFSDDPVWHAEGCRGPIEGFVDVCGYCDTAVFANARTRSEYENRERYEVEQRTSRTEKEKREEEAREKATRDSASGCAVMLLVAGFATASLIVFI